jgi:hypothetical protein
MFQGTEDLEVFPPNITKPYRESSPCHNRWKKPRPRKKPGEVDEPSSRDRDTIDQIYHIVKVHESSKLNNGAWNAPSSFVFISYIVSVVR